MSFMQNQVLGYESPLYGRRTDQFMIEPLTYGVDELALLEKYASVFGKGTKYHYYSNFFQKFTCITIAAKRIFIQKSKSNFNRQFYKLSLSDHSYNVKYR